MTDAAPPDCLCPQHALALGAMASVHCIDCSRGEKWWGRCLCWCHRSTGGGLR